MTILSIISALLGWISGIHLNGWCISLELSVVFYINFKYRHGGLATIPPLILSVCFLGGLVLAVLITGDLSIGGRIKWLFTGG